MAIDSRDKRASAASVLAPWRLLLPGPDAGAEDQGDRQQMARCYRGILAGTAVTTLTAYPDPFAATSSADGPSPMLATSTPSIDPFAATSRLLGS